ncbi:hypothetical protein [Dendronalium phyllosphericum]|uniref:hypothetical protein n=1 Tax=Dendronalium phyllosphericum TaxID=2840445 RepID=UPI001BDD0FD8|nr:hypothetical protein [Dendronalium phyllosphericum]
MMYAIALIELFNRIYLLRQNHALTDSTLAIAFSSTSSHLFLHYVSAALTGLRSS